MVLKEMSSSISNGALPLWFVDSDIKSLFSSLNLGQFQAKTRKVGLRPLKRNFFYFFGPKDRN